MTFHSPAYLYLLLLLIPVIGWYIWELRKSEASFKLSSLSGLAEAPGSIRIYLIHIPFVLRVAAIILLSIALARPQLSNRWHQESTEGIDIMMAVDISGTMQQFPDLEPNRLEAAKKVACEFINDRPNDNIGLVVFAGESFTQCPLTTDHQVLVNLFNSLNFGMIDDGTAIGLGLANAVNRIKDSQTKSKVIILLTDGSNNCGDIDPLTAAEIAQSFGIRVYTIGVGSNKPVKIPYQTLFGTQYYEVDPQFDETTLREIAQITDGQYFRATDNNSLKQIYEQIDQLEKTKIKVREYAKHEDNFEPFLFAAIVCLMLDVLLKWFVLRSITQ